MKEWRPEEVVALVQEMLRRRYGQLELITGQGIAAGQRITFLEDGKRIRCLIKTSMRGRISFKRRDDGTWSGLSETDRVVVAAPNKRQEGADVFIWMFRQETLIKAFEANYAAMKAAGSVDGEGRVLPNWIATFHEDGRGPRGVGDGFGSEAIWTEPLNTASMPASAPKVTRDRVRALTIAEAKIGLAKTFGVLPEAVEITIRG